MQEEKDVFTLCPSFRRYVSPSMEEESEHRVAERFIGDGEDEFQFSSDQFFDHASPVHSSLPIFNRVLRSDYSAENFTLQRHDGDLIPENRRHDPGLLFENRDLLLDNSVEDRPSSSPLLSSEESDIIRKGVFSSWKSKASEEQARRCGKSKSAGSASRNWKIIDLIRRCNSADEKNSMVLLSSVPISKKKKGDSKVEKIVKGRRSFAGESEKGNKSKGGQQDMERFSSAHEILYAKPSKEGDRRRTFLPFRQDLIAAFFARENGISSKLPPCC